jgi:hypothetical protein
MKRKTKTVIACLLTGLVLLIISYRVIFHKATPVPPIANKQTYIHEFPYAEKMLNAHPRDDEMQNDGIKWVELALKNKLHSIKFDLHQYKSKVIANHNCPSIFTIKNPEYTSLRKMLQTIIDHKGQNKLV